MLRIRVVFGVQQRSLGRCLREYCVMPLFPYVPRESRSAPHGYGGCVGKNLAHPCRASHAHACTMLPAQALLRKRGCASAAVACASVTTCNSDLTNRAISPDSVSVCCTSIFQLACDVYGHLSVVFLVFLHAVGATNRHPVFWVLRELTLLGGMHTVRRVAAPAVPEMLMLAS